MQTVEAQNREYDFALILTGITELTSAAEDALFEAGCDDATFSVRHGRVYATFTRTAPRLLNAVLSAIRDVKKANVGADVLRINNCDLVTQAEIARRIGRTRQLVNQYISGKRGPGGFPAPVCHLTDESPLWAWCEVAYWLSQNDMLPHGDELAEAQWLAMINNVLDFKHQRKLDPTLMDQLMKEVAGSGK